MQLLDTVSKWCVVVWEKECHVSDVATLYVYVMYPGCFARLPARLQKLNTIYNIIPYMCVHGTMSLDMTFPQT